MKPIEQWERERGIVINGDVEPTKAVDAETFDKLVAENGFSGVNHADREAYLRSKGHALTRENLVNSDL